MVAANVKRRRKEVRLSRRHETTLTGLTPADTLRAVWSRGRFVLLIDTDNGVRIDHKALTQTPAKA